MAARAKEREGKAAKPSPMKPIGDRKFRTNCVYEEEFCDIVYEVLSQGGSVYKACQALGIGVQKFNSLCEIAPDFKEAVDAGKAASIVYWEEMGELNLENRGFNDRIWKHMLVTKHEVKDPSRVILNVDSSSNAAQVAEMLEQLEKGKI